MFGILTFKKLSCICLGLCLIIITGAFLSAVSPIVPALSQNSVTLGVIMYHQISNNKSLWGDYVIPPETLEEDFAYMKKHGFNPVSVKELKAYTLGHGTLPKNPVLITFDDGERSFITKVVPLLEKYNYPAVVSVVGALTDMYSENGETNDSYAYLNWNDVKLLSENPLVEIGNHSYNFHSLGKRRGMARLSGESESDYLSAVNYDIDKLQAELKEHTGESTDIMAYPYGIRNDLLMETLKAKGFNVTLTCRESTNTVSAGGNLYELGRFNRPYSVSTERFFERF